jgi:hypothetical protein
VPKSRVRTKTSYTPPPTRSPKKVSSAPWVGGAMGATFLVGIVWLVLFYVTGGSLPVSSINNWNLLVGFGFIMVGFGIATQWK